MGKEFSTKSERVTFFRTWLMASGQESTILPFCQDGEGHRIPMSCLITASTLTPERKASEIKRPAASICDEAQPPVLPI